MLVLLYFFQTSVAKNHRKSRKSQRNHEKSALRALLFLRKWKEVPGSVIQHFPVLRMQIRYTSPLPYEKKNKKYENPAKAEQPLALSEVLPSLLLGFHIFLFFFHMGLGVNTRWGGGSAEKPSACAAEASYSF